MSSKSILKYLIAIFFLAVQAGFAQPKIVSIKLDNSLVKANAGSEVKVVLIAAIEKGWHINSHKPNDEFLIPTTVVSGNNAFPISKIVFPKPMELELSFSDKPVSVFEGETKIELTFKIDKNAKTEKVNIPIEFGYQGCNDQTCLPPTTDKINLTLDITEYASGAESALSNQAANDTASQEQVNSSEQAKQYVPEENKADEDVSAFESRGLFLSLLIVFLGGLALNLTPCVYPLIPITIGYFGGQTEGRTSKLFMLGLFYVLGLAITYSIVGVITALSGAMFGALLQQPVVILFISLIFVALALSMFGVYEFKLPDSWAAKVGGAKSGITGAFFMGLTMGIVAAPCIGPFVLSLVTVVAAKGDAVYGFVMFFTLALGLGLPYLFLALFSGKLKSLPRAGLWMEAVKRIFGFIMIGMALYFAGPLLPKVVNSYLLPFYGIIVAIFLFFFDKTANSNKGFNRFKNVFSVVIIAVSIYAILPSKGTSIVWQPFEQSAFDNAKASNNKIIIDFMADWCIPCKELDAQTFSDQKVIEASADFKTFKADLTQTGSETTEKLRKEFNVIGVPTVLIFDSNGNEQQRITGFVNAEEFLKILNEIK
ncbi:MAG: thioredoxin [Ignavibacteria bacterium]|nr:MAG: thioredoxin [Ignavibacteria bacterium]KAF0161983.1 MAG: thioredoxin [Ignavibacteria bacterium]